MKKRVSKIHIIIIKISVWILIETWRTLSMTNHLNFAVQPKTKIYFSICLKVLQSDKLSDDGHIFQVLPYLNSLIMIRLPFSQQEYLQIFPNSLATWNICPAFRFRVRDPKTIFYYQRDVATSMPSIFY